MTDQVDLLVDIILDEDARCDEKDDAAMYLGDIANEKALNAALQLAQMPQIAADSYENDMILDSLGESIAQIWIVLNRFDLNSYNKLPPTAQRSAKMFIIYQKPEWSFHFS